MILFLDFDGVMHPISQLDLFCREEHLARVMRDFPSVEIVISSTWRETHTLKNMQSLFLTDLRSRIVGVTPVIKIRDAVDVLGVRLREINEYLVETGSQRCPWVALDDAPELFPSDCPELVLCDSHHGFSNATEQALRAVLNEKSSSELLETVTLALRNSYRTEKPSHDETQRWIETVDTQTGRTTWARRDLFDEWNRLQLKIRSM